MIQIIKSAKNHMCCPVIFYIINDVYYMLLVESY